MHVSRSFLNIGRCLLAAVTLATLPLRAAPAAEQAARHVVFLVDPAEQVATRTNYYRPILLTLMSLEPKDSCSVYVGRHRVLELEATPALLDYQRSLYRAIDRVAPKLQAGLKSTVASAEHSLDYLSWASRQLLKSNAQFVFLTQATNLPPVALDNLYGGDVQSIVGELTNLGVIPSFQACLLIQNRPTLQDEALSRILDRLWCELGRKSGAIHRMVSLEDPKQLPNDLKQSRNLPINSSKP